MGKRKNIAILGSTGSIGQSALDVVRGLEVTDADREEKVGINVVGLSGASRLDLLCEQASEFSPDVIVAADEPTASKFDWPDSLGCEIKVGAEALVELAVRDEIDIVLASIVGSAGLASTWAAIEKGKTIALANKETLVVAGQQVMRLAERSGSPILPVDSEHNAIFQCLKSQGESVGEVENQDVRRIVLTASGGPFREFTAEQLKCVTVEQALAHPTWNMGAKISVDSATMMNKALEIIEARWLFGIEPERIRVMVHPQSVIHSLVEFVDGSVVAQMSPPDMKLPIQYALTYPERVEGPSPQMDWAQAISLDLLPADFDRFPALALGFEVARSGGTAGAVLNAANEAAVAAFLKQEIAFTDIVSACREILNQHNFEPDPSIDQLMAADRWAREEMSQWIVA